MTRYGFVSVAMLFLVSCANTKDNGVIHVMPVEPVEVVKVVKTVVTDVMDCAKAKFDNCIFETPAGGSSNAGAIPEGLSNEELEQYVQKHLRN